MSYFVVLPSGQKFGPADLTLLKQWVAEGRIEASTQIEDQVSGQRLVAASVPGLIPPRPGSTTQTGFAPPSSFAGRPGGNPAPSQFSQPPSQFQGYYRGPATAPTADQQSTVLLVFSYLCSFGSLIFCVFCPLVGIIFPIIGLVLSNQAAQKGNPNTQPARISAIVMICIWFVLIVAFFLFIGSVSK